ncbi:hypothetical protein BU24DRAFT_91760 [Aaosphaeria arxii CBS 175.79]|uniref:Uncharacterized protein n=1 Tax=Aaosphaeria arxii CBS 175.79 TaxID=1450172 RepID=A0A6A5X7A9_9PLEO|nr:uncharacterized protein BU24DRAFT_91760 [Aaosphaeria arxii CBS 175.79]KAF2008801.1 hypothetical protein BU24DRAFT_91760 [Aaosphaeria arxii CBS 175.79]
MYNIQRRVRCPATQKKKGTKATMPRRSRSGQSSRPIHLATGGGVWGLGAGSSTRCHCGLLYLVSLLCSFVGGSGISLHWQFHVFRLHWKLHVRNVEKVGLLRLDYSFHDSSGNCTIWLL